MKRRKNNTVLALMFVLMLLVGCRTAKQPVAVVEPEVRITRSELETMEAFKPVGDAFTAKVKINADISGTEAAAAGNMKIEQGGGMSIGITALGLFELARLEVSPSDLQFLNKVTKEYAALTYTDVGFLRDAGLSYRVLEAMLMNEIFSPDPSVPLDKAVANMKISLQDNSVVLTTEEQDGMVYSFYLDRHSGNLMRTDGTYNNSITVVCRYSDFRQFNDRAFPYNITIDVEGVDEEISINLNLSNVRNDSYSFAKSNVSSYREINIEKLLQSVGK